MSQEAKTDLKARSTAKTKVTQQIISNIVHHAPATILVVGCGSGQEAGVLARAFGADTIGIDLGDQFDHAEATPAVLKTMDAQQLGFPDAMFDLVFSFHALEHILDPRRALSEMARVLRHGGTYFIGTPNKSRLLGYLGGATSLRNKIVWNLSDLAMRARGNWSNEAGAHAGFTRRDLLQLCGTAFGECNDVTDAYYRQLYPDKRVALDMLIGSGLHSVVYPCVYVAGHKIL